MTAVSKGSHTQVLHVCVSKHLLCPEVKSKKHMSLVKECVESHAVKFAFATVQLWERFSGCAQVVIVDKLLPCYLTCLLTSSVIAKAKHVNEHCWHKA